MRRAVAASLLAGAGVLVLAGCGSGQTLGGESIANADEWLEEADAELVAMTRDASAEGTTVLSDDSRCYFEADDEGDIGQSVFCGPVRTLVHGDDWYTMTFDEKVNADGDIVLAEHHWAGSGNPAGELSRPDGAKPADVENLAEPQAPATVMKDFVVAVPRDSFGAPVTLEPLESPGRVLAPAATFEVSQGSPLEAIPAEVLTWAGADPHASASPVFRPADGQAVSVWLLDVTSPVEFGPEHDSGWLDDDGLRDASASVAVDVAGQRLQIAGGLGADEDSGSIARIECGHVQCVGRDAQQYLLFVSAAEGAEPALSVTTDGRSATAVLGTSEVGMDHSSVAQDRERLRQQVSVAWASKTATVVSSKERGRHDEIDYTYGGDVPAVYLTPFDAASGWAPEGRAWLVVPVENWVSDFGYEAEDASIDWVKSWSLKTADEAFSAEPLDVTGRAVFEVPAEFTEGTVVYQPTGSLSYRWTDPDSWSDYEDRREAFTVDEALKVEVEFP